MEANEPCLGRWVHDDASGLEGLVIEVKTGGWRVVLSVKGNSVNRRSGALEYAAGEPPAELVNTCQQLYNVPYAPATEAMRKKVLSRRRQEEIYKPRSKAPAPAPRPPAPRATLTSQKVRRGLPPPRRRQAAASPFPRPALAQIKPPPGPGAPTVGDAVARLTSQGWRRGVVVARKPEDGPVEAHWSAHKKECKAIARAGGPEDHYAATKMKAAAARAAAACAKSQKDAVGARCYVCLGGANESEGLVRGCEECSSYSGYGFAHVSCLARHARVDAAKSSHPWENRPKNWWKEDDDRGSPDSDLTHEIRNRFAYNMRGIGW